MPIYDVTMPISPSLPVWPGDPPVVIERIFQLEAGAAYSLSRLSLGTHCGTHVDAPAHYLPGGTTVDALPLDVLVGTAYVLHIPQQRIIDATTLTAFWPQTTITRLLLKTGWSLLALKDSETWLTDYPALTLDAAEWLVKQGVRLLGIESPSVERFADDGGTLVHYRLLSAGMVIVEGLDLGAVSAGVYGMSCLPLRLQGGDGAPARVVLTDGRLG